MFKRMDIYNNNCNMIQMAMINSIPKQNNSQRLNQYNPKEKSLKTYSNVNIPHL